MTLKDLLDAIDPHRESTEETIQLCRYDGEWDDFDEVVVSSLLLLPLYTAKVKAIQAIKESVLRVEIDWDGLVEQTHLNEWKGKEE